MATSPSAISHSVQTNVVASICPSLNDAGCAHPALAYTRHTSTKSKANSTSSSHVNTPIL